MNRFTTLMEHIPLGEANAKPMEQLASELGVNTRALRHMISDARFDGCVIASGDNGYFQPVTVPELKEYLNRRTHAARFTFATLKPVRQRLKELEEQ